MTRFGSRVCKIADVNGAGHMYSGDLEKKSREYVHVASAIRCMVLYNHKHAGQNASYEQSLAREWRCKFMLRKGCKPGAKNMSPHNADSLVMTTKYVMTL